MKKIAFFVSVLAVVLLSSCQQEAKVGTAYLSLEFTDQIDDYLFGWIYDSDGVLSITREFETVDEHTALLAVDSVSGFADVDVWTLNTHAGVRIVPGDTIHVKFTAAEGKLYPESVRQMYADSNSDLDETFYVTECLNPVKDNDIVDAIVQAFNGGDMLRNAVLADAGIDDSLYFHALPEYEQRFADLRTSFGKRLKGQLASFADLRRAYMLNDMRITVSKEQGIAEDDVPGSDWYFQFIQPNNLTHATMNLTNDWLEHEARKVVPDETQPQFAYTMLSLADSLLTNPAKAEWLDRWSQTQLFGLYSVPFNEIAPLWKRYGQVAADCPEVLAKWQKKYDQVMATAPGKPVKDITLQAPDGTEVQLSSLFGKLLYIDVWATWCGPCCAEIPYIEKLVEQFKDNDRVAFVSFSVDNTVEPWLQKIKADHPSWAQYHLAPEQEKQFCADWDIHGIPRFLMIAPDGTICDANAPRPSAPRTAAYIEECVQKYNE